MKIAEEVQRELENLRIHGILSNVVITRSRSGPWTLSLVEYEDGSIGYGCANNEHVVPDNVDPIGDRLGDDVHEIIDDLKGENSIFTNSLLLSLSSALSHKAFQERSFLERNGVAVESPSKMPLLDPSKFVEESDTVAMVGYHYTATPLCSKIAEKVLVTELKDVEEFSVFDFRNSESNVEVFPAEENADVLSQADVVYITGETVVNGTFGDLVRNTKDARSTIIYGPTSSFHPAPLFERGVDVSLPIIFPDDPEFQKEFALRRGYWYSMEGVKQLLVERGVENGKEAERENEKNRKQ